MTSKINIFNRALSLVGDKRITTPDEDTEAAKECVLWYDISRQSLLKDLNASFAITRATLAEVADFKPAYGYNNAFALPNDCLKVLNIEDPMRNELYQEEQNLLYCNYQKRVNIRYLFDNKNIYEYDADFKKLLTLELAVNICLPLTLNEQRAVYLEQKRDKQYVRTSSKYGNDNRIVIINKPRFSASKLSYREEFIR